jgi:hypothetical protein
MNGFRAELKLPSISLIVSEITVQEQINLTKALMQEEVLGLHDFVQKHLSPSEGLNIIDFLLGMIYCREISSGGSLFLAKDNTTYEVVLEKWKRHLYPIYERLNHTSFDGLSLEISYETWDKVLSGAPLLKVTHIDGKEVDMDQLPIKMYHTLQRHLAGISLPKICLLEPFNDWVFDFKPQSIWYLLSLLFQRDLESTYETMFILHKECNIDCKKLTPGEFMLYTKHYQALMASAQNTESDDSETEWDQP